MLVCLEAKQCPKECNFDFPKFRVLVLQNCMPIKRLPSPLSIDPKAAFLSLSFGPKMSCPFA